MAGTGVEILFLLVDLFAIGAYDDDALVLRSLSRLSDEVRD